MNFNMQDKEFLKEIDYIVGIANSARSPGATSVFSDISMAGDKAGTDNTNHNSWTEPAQVENTDIGANMDLSNKEAPESDASTPGNITDIQLSTKIAELLQQVQKKFPTTPPRFRRRRNSPAPPSTTLTRQKKSTLS